MSEPWRLTGWLKEGPVPNSLELLLGLNSYSGIPFNAVPAHARSDPCSPVIQEGRSLLGASREPTPPLSLSDSPKQTFLPNQALLWAPLFIFIPASKSSFPSFYLRIITFSPCRSSSIPAPLWEASSQCCSPLTCGPLPTLPSLNKPTLRRGSAQALASGVLNTWVGAPSAQRTADSSGWGGVVVHRIQ